MKYWLFKTEPNEFSIEDLANSPGQTTRWDGIRNYQARNYLREMKKGDRVLYYHSSAKPTGVAVSSTISEGSSLASVVNESSVRA